MKYLYSLFVLLVVFAAVTFAQQTLDPANYITVDNFPSSPNATSDADSSTSITDEYYENRGWYTSGFSATNASISWPQGPGGHRQKSRLGGAEVIGATATWVATIPPDKGGTWLVYNYVLQSANNAANVFYTLRREFESVNVDSMRHDMRKSMWNHQLGVTTGSWSPLMINTFVGGTKAFVTMGADSASGPTIMRADAVRFLRSTSTGADLEFGKRHRDNFDIQRVAEVWLDSPLGTVTYKDLPVFNLGKQDLVISDVHAMVTPNRWMVKLPNNGVFPLVVPPGEKRILQVGYRPFQEEITQDTLVIVSNDSLELQATMPVFGNGINYNFILNASNTNEPHYNAPFNSVENPKRPEIIITGPFLNSTAASFPYPVPNGNRASIVNTAGPQTDPTIQVEHRFHLPDSVNGQPGSTGNYYIEWGILGGSTNGSSNAKVRIITPFSTDTIKANLNMQFATTPPPLTSFTVIGGKSHLLNQGGMNKVVFSYVTADDQSAAGGFLRVDLLRIRKVPTGPSIAATQALNFGNVSVYENQRLIDNNYHLDVEINSNGESALTIDSIIVAENRFKRFYALTGLPSSFPTQLPAINGSLKFTVNFLPDSIADSLNTTIRVYSNDTLFSPHTITITAAGIGTSLTMEEAESPASFIFPSGPVFYPDFANMNKWQQINDAGASGGKRLVGYIYNLDGDPSIEKNAGYVEYFPALPTLPGRGVELDTFAVYARMTPGSSNSSPRAKYSIFSAGGGRADSIVNQNNRGSMVFLGNHIFLRSGQRDAHGGAAINGYIRLENDTALVNAYYKDSVENIAKRDTFVIRADAIILFESESSVLGVGYEVSPTVPAVYSLSQNYPNPFNPTTKIQFGLPHAGRVQLKIFDILGREVKTLINEHYNAGSYAVDWDGRNNFGGQVATGMYVYHIQSGGFIQAKKMLLVK